MRSPTVIREASRPLRADAERNRRRLLDAAAEVFAERGLEAGVGEIAERAGIGRGTLFRNFPTKQDLIAAVAVQRMRLACERGRRLAGSPDPGAALSLFLEQLLGRRGVDRALFEALDDAFLAHADIQAAHHEMLDVLDALLERAQRAGAVRGDVCALDLVMLVKGISETACAFRRADPELAERHLALVRAALSPAAAQATLAAPRALSLP